jgi:hypothetical protein
VKAFVNPDPSRPFPALDETHGSPRSLRMTSPGVLNGASATRDYLVLAFLASAASLLSFIHYYRAHEILLYGDAVAHINIARRVFDSITPGPFRLGTVWLPLPHILTIPFIISNWMWRTGVGGSIISMIAYVAGTVGIFRLVRTAIGTSQRRGLAWLAAAIYAANPNLLYLQATAMTESLYLALFIWTVVFAQEFVESHSPRALERSALVLAVAMLTRYDGWFLAACVAVALFAWRVSERSREIIPGLRPAARNFVLLLAAVAGLWFAYNYREYGNPVEFATGPYSARAIEHRIGGLDPAYPGSRDLLVASKYFLKATKLNLGMRPWELLLLLTAVAGVVLTLAFERRSSILSLLWAPLLFYPLSTAYGDVPIFVPVWWPFSYYNVRYGLELLPAVAVFAALAFAILQRPVPQPKWRSVLAFVAIVLVAASYSSVWRTGPICLREARVNGSARQRFERALGRELKTLSPSATLLIYTGDHPGALSRAGIPLRRSINENNHPQWEQALADPAGHADIIVAVGNDVVAHAVSAHPAGLRPMAVVQTPEQPRTTIYKSLVRVRP